MIPNLHPVDELALLRAEIRRLEEREAKLRALLLRPGAHLRGGIAQAEVKTTRRRTFLRDLLPATILSDPVMWEENVVRAVVIQPLATPRGRPTASAPAGRPSAPPPRG